MTPAVSCAAGFPALLRTVQLAKKRRRVRDPRVRSKMMRLPGIGGGEASVSFIITLILRQSLHIAH